MPKLAEFKVSFNLPAVLEQTDYLRKIVESAVIPAVQAGAEVFYKEVKGRAAGFADTGNLARSIYQYRNKDEQRPGHAQYKISWRKGTGKAAIKTKGGREAGDGLPVAAHGILVEYGYIQRYAVNKAEDGQWYTIVRPENRGKKPPWVGAGKRKRDKRPTRAQSDAWFLPRPGGPVQWLPRSFLRAGFEAAKTRALDAARMEMQKQINRGMV